VTPANGRIRDTDQPPDHTQNSLVGKGTMTPRGWPGSPIARMSTTHQSHTTAHEASRDLGDLYQLLIFESPEICSSCHSRIRAPRTAATERAVKADRLARHSRESETLGTGDDQLDALRRGGDGTAAYDCRDMDKYGVKRDYYLRTYCGECGQPGGKALDESPSKLTMLEAVPALVNRLAEQQIPANPDVLGFVVGHLSSQEDYSGKETEIWSVATRMAVERARPRDCVRATYGHQP